MINFTTVYILPSFFFLWNIKQEPFTYVKVGPNAL